MERHGEPVAGNDERFTPRNRNFSMNRHDWLRTTTTGKRTRTASDFRAQQNRIRRFRAGK